MKVTELMIGDWVSYNGKPVLVEALNKSNGYAIEKDMISIKLTEDTCLGIDADRLEPIPLTNEILKSNGFKRLLNADGMETDHDTYLTYHLDEHSYLDYYGFEHRFRRWYHGVDEWDNHRDSHEITFECHPFYVHELQHALKMIYFDKEIQL